MRTTSKVKCPANDVNPAEKQAMQARVGACHETLHKQLKNWGILSHPTTTTSHFSAMCFGRAW
jgi:hypothetical protein